MIQQSQYYYLVSGLPELELEQPHLPLSPEILRTMLRESLHPDDFKQFEFLLLKHDHRRLLSSVIPAGHHPMLLFPGDELVEKLSQPGKLPPYYYRFREALQQDKPIWTGLSWENQLTRLYYEYVTTAANTFLQQWFAFERDLGNILTAIHCRLFDIPIHGQLIGENPLTTALLRRHSRDFGLSNEFPFVEQLLLSAERDDLWEQEQVINRIKWHYLDQATTFHYFTIEVLLSYFIKLSLLHRRMTLLQHHGSQLALQKIEKFAAAAATVPGAFNTQSSHHEKPGASSG